MFVIGHDCGHRSFSKNKLVEDIVGTLMFMPLIYPFEPWRIKHNHHHAHTNKCGPCSCIIPLMLLAAQLACSCPLANESSSVPPERPATVRSGTPVARLEPCREPGRSAKSG